MGAGVSTDVEEEIRSIDASGMAASGAGAGGATPMTLKGRVTVFSISGCPHCRRAKSLLRERGVPFVEVNLDVYPERRAEAQERSKRKTVPQIFFNDRHIGGADELVALARDDAAWNEAVAHVVENEASAAAPSPPDPSRRQSAELSESREDPMMDFVRTLKANVRVSDRMYHLQVSSPPPPPPPPPGPCRMPGHVGAPVGFMNVFFLFFSFCACFVFLFWYCALMCALRARVVGCADVQELLCRKRRGDLYCGAQGHFPRRSRCFWARAAVAALFPSRE